MKNKKAKTAKLGKKGATAITETMAFVYKAIYALFIIGLVVFLIKLVVITSVPTEKIEIYSFSQRIQNSPELLYQEPGTGKTYQGIIDLDKIIQNSQTNHDNLEKNIDYPNKNKFCAKITAHYYNLENQGFVGPPLVQQQTIFINKELYELLEAPSKAGIKGPGSGTIYHKKVPVSFKQQEKILDGFLEIQIIRKND